MKRIVNALGKPNWICSQQNTSTVKLMQEVLAVKFSVRG